MPIDQLQITTTISLALVLEADKQVCFPIVSGDDQLAATTVGDAMALAEGIEPMLSIDTKTGLEASLRIIKPCVNNLAIAGGRC